MPSISPHTHKADLGNDFFFSSNIINDHLQLIIWCLKEHKLQWDIRFNNGPFTKQENTRSKEANDIQRAEKRG